MLTRRQTLAAIVSLPVCNQLGALATNAGTFACPECPSWADDWNGVAASMASMERFSCLQDYPRTFDRLAYSGCIQFGADYLLIYGCRRWHDFRRHLRPGTTWDILGYGTAGEFWGIVATGVLSERLKQELRQDTAARERRQWQAERQITMA